MPDGLPWRGTTAVPFAPTVGHGKRWRVSEWTPSNRSASLTSSISTRHKRKQQDGGRLGFGLPVCFALQFLRKGGQLAKKRNN